MGVELYLNIELENKDFKITTDGLCQCAIKAKNKQSFKILFK